MHGNSSGNSNHIQPAGDNGSTCHHLHRSECDTDSKRGQYLHMEPCHFFECNHRLIGDSQSQCNHYLHGSWRFKRMHRQHPGDRNGEPGTCDDGEYTCRSMYRTIGNADSRWSKHLYLESFDSIKCNDRFLGNGHSVNDNNLHSDG